MLERKKAFLTSFPGIKLVSCTPQYENNGALLFQRLLRLSSDDAFFFMPGTCNMSFSFSPSPTHPVANKCGLSTAYMSNI